MMSPSEIIIVWKIKNWYEIMLVKAFCTVRQSHDKRRHGVPGALAKAFGPLPAIGDEHSAFLNIAGMLDGVFILFHQIKIARLPHDGYPNFLHASTSILHNSVSNRQTIGFQQSQESAAWAGWLISSGLPGFYCPCRYSEPFCK